MIQRCTVVHRTNPAMQAVRAFATATASPNYTQLSSLHLQNIVPSKADADDVAKQFYRPMSPKTIRRQALKRLNPWYVSTEEFAKLKNPFGQSVSTKLPVEERAPGPEHLMRILRKEELERIQKLYPRRIEDFRSGDKIAVTKHISLFRSKFEIISGIVIEKRNGKGVHSMFTIRNTMLGEAFELSLPLWSPFITDITVMERGTATRNKLYHIREWEHERFEVRIPTPGFLDRLRKQHSIEDSEKERKDAKRKEKEAKKKAARESRLARQVAAATGKQVEEDDVIDVADWVEQSGESKAGGRRKKQSKE